MTTYCFTCHNVCPCDKDDTGFAECKVCGTSTICYRCVCDERETERNKERKVESVKK